MTGQGPHQVATDDPRNDRCFSRGVAGQPGRRPEVSTCHGSLGGCECETLAWQTGHATCGTGCYLERNGCRVQGVGCMDGTVKDREQNHKIHQSTLNFIFCGYMIFAVIFLLDMIWLGIFGLQGLPWQIKVPSPFCLKPLNYLVR